MTNGHPRRAGYLVLPVLVLLGATALVFTSPATPTSADAAVPSAPTSTQVVEVHATSADAVGLPILLSDTEMSTVRGAGAPGYVICAGLFLRGLALGPGTAAALLGACVGALAVL